MDRQKVRLHLMKVAEDVTAEQIVDLFRAITGREPTADEIGELDRELAHIRSDEEREEPQ